MNADRRPLPRFWYFPRGEKAVVVMTGDDHANNGTYGRFQAYQTASPVGCSVADWECVRGTSYIYPNTPLAPLDAEAFEADGFEIAVHVNTDCGDWNATSLQTFFATQIADFAAKYTTLDAPATNRTHCIAWSDWATQAKVSQQNGIRLDTNYYYWPGSWILDRPGFMTGSGLPMRFADLDSALARSVPVVTARQMLTWLGGRNGSKFGAITWSGNTLSFTVTAATGANGLRGMIPTTTSAGMIASLTVSGNPVAFTTETIKGISYAVFPAASGAYVATYAP